MYATTRWLQGKYKLLVLERGKSWLQCPENWLWKRLSSCRKRDNVMKWKSLFFIFIFMNWRVKS